MVKQGGFGAGGAVGDGGAVGPPPHVFPPPGALPLPLPTLLQQAPHWEHTADASRLDTGSKSVKHDGEPEKYVLHGPFGPLKRPPFRHSGKLAVGESADGANVGTVNGVGEASAGADVVGLSLTGAEVGKPENAGAGLDVVGESPIGGPVGKLVIGPVGNVDGATFGCDVSGALVVGEGPKGADVDGGSVVGANIGVALGTDVMGAIAVGADVVGRKAGAAVVGENVVGAMIGAVLGDAVVGGVELATTLISPVIWAEQCGMHM